MARYDGDGDAESGGRGRGPGPGQRDVLDVRNADRSYRRRDYLGEDDDENVRRRRPDRDRRPTRYDDDRDEQDDRDRDDDRDRRDRGAADDRPQRRGSGRGDEHRGDGDRRGGADDRDRDDKTRGQADKDKDGDKDKESDKSESRDEKDSRERRERRRPIIYVIGAVLLLLLIAGGVYYYMATRDLESTDDAFTDGRVVNIAPQVSGQVISLDVTDNQFVHKGDPLIHIDARTFIYDRDQSKGTLDSVAAQVESQKLGVEIAKKNFPASLTLAQANLDSSKANLVLMAANLARQKGLPKQATTQQDVDQAQSNYDQAKAQVEENEAKVTQAEPVQQNIGQSQQQVSQSTAQGEQSKGKFEQSNLNVEWSVVRAPQDGWVTQRNVDMGNYVQAGQQIMSLVTPDIWVTANYKETQLDRMRPGQHVDIKVDAYSNLKLSGHVDSVQRGSGSRFSAFPAQNATGNYVKIVQRVPVKILIDSGLDPNEPVPVGISVVPTVTVR